MHQKCVYVDGHNRPDVLEAEMLMLKERMYRLLPDCEVLSLYFHDETTAKENDDGNHKWMSNLKGAAIRVKGEGRAAHISDVIGVDHWPLQLGKEQWAMMQEDRDVVKTKNDPSTAAVVMTVGAHQDGYWTCDRMCAQLPGIFAIMELTSEPYRQGVVIFDNSTGHGAYDDDALLPQNINMAPGGEKVAFAPLEDDN
ncbi:unnamed protein product, partial [Scytosiphon promiscuus]